MASLHALDQRILDQSLTGGASVSLPMRPRYNTPMMTRFLDSSRPTGVSAPPPGIAGRRPFNYNEYWDADLQSYMYLQDFLESHPGWMAEFAKVALDNGVQSQRMSQDRLDSELKQILDFSPRARRAVHGGDRSGRR
jgi:hypothetical protein